MHKDYDRKIIIDTQYPVAFDSPDHTHPWGTMRDNHSNESFIQEIEAYFGRPFSVLDIGCSGGLLIHDFHNRGNVAVGIEGSDYSVVHQRAEWPELHNKNLFTCDASRDYQIQFEDTKEVVKFDLITSWDVIEHIHPDRLEAFFQNVQKHLADEGIFVGSISTVGDKSSGTQLHLSQHSESHWMSEILPQYFDGSPYPFTHAVRKEHGSFYFFLKHKRG
jgi:cyclopropane fatty-acyl-phospholipid synthase-like methyltransferase